MRSPARASTRRPAAHRTTYDEPRRLATEIRSGFTVAVASILLLAITTSARAWEEEDFWKRTLQSYTYSFELDPRPGHPAERTVIGVNQTMMPKKGDTFFDLARYYGLGYNELVDANPGTDEWIPSYSGKSVTVPTQFILPCCTYAGVVINIPEMRLYYFPPSSGKQAADAAPATRKVITFPVGLGREEWKTPVGAFRIRDKTVNPDWVIPESIRKERIADAGFSEAMIPGGDPRNPLGKYRMRLSIDLYGIHGTNIPWGVGMLVSHGCVRLYPEDIEKLFPLLPIGTTGEFVYEPVKIGFLGGDVWVEVHKDLYGKRPGVFRETLTMLEKRGLLDRIDRGRLENAVLEQSGMPVNVSREPGANFSPPPPGIAQPVDPPVATQPPSPGTTSTRVGTTAAVNASQAGAAAPRATSPNSGTARTSRQTTGATGRVVKTTTVPRSASRPIPTARAKPVPAATAAPASSRSR